MFDWQRTGFLWKTFFVATVLSVVFLFSCEDDQFYEKKEARLIFSLDTIRFDTIFSKSGSVTREFTVLNSYDKRLNVNSIRLMGGNESPFRLNVDGVSASYFADVIIDRNDSMYVFVEVSPNNTGLDTAIFVSDSIEFNTNGNLQYVRLEVWGQDYSLVVDTLSGNTVWSGRKPFIVYGRLVVDSLQTLTIEEGVNVYFHRGAELYVKGSLFVNGAVNNRVVFSGDRLDEQYEHVPGVWKGLSVANGATVALNNASIFNAVNSLILGEPSFDGLGADAVLNNVEFIGATKSCIYSIDARIRASNCVFADCGTSLVSMIGGDFGFYHCSFADYLYSSAYASFNKVAVGIHSTVSKDSVDYFKPLRSGIFLNSIIHGNKRDEILFTLNDTTGLSSLRFNNCMLTYSGDTTSSVFAENLFLSRTDTSVFLDPSEYLFGLDSISKAKDFVSSESIDTLLSDLKQKLMFDFNGNERNDGMMDLGAFEYVRD